MAKDETTATEEPAKAKARPGRKPSTETPDLPPMEPDQPHYIAVDQTTKVRTVKWFRSAKERDAYAAERAQATQRTVFVFGPQEGVVYPEPPKPPAAKFTQFHQTKEATGDA